MKQLEMVIQVNGLFKLYGQGLISRDEFQQQMDDVVKCYYYDEGEFEIYRHQVDFEKKL